MSHKLWEYHCSGSYEQTQSGCIVRAAPVHYVFVDNCLGLVGKCPPPLLHLCAEGLEVKNPDSGWRLTQTGLATRIIFVIYFVILEKNLLHFWCVCGTMSFVASEEGEGDGDYL